MSNADQITQQTALTPSSPDVRPLMVDAKHAATLCGVSRSGWWKLHSSGRCPVPIRLGRKTLWRVAELTDWLNDGCPTGDRWTWQPNGSA